MSTWQTNLLKTSGLTPLASFEKAVSNATPTPLSDSYLGCKTLMLQGGSENTGKIWVGTQGSGNQKIVIQPGQSIFIPVSDVSLVYALAETDGEFLVCWPFK